MRPLPATLVLVASLVAAQEPPSLPSFSSQVELVTVDVVVLDAKGGAVRGLRREDFALFEVPEAAGLHLTTPILTDRLRPAAKGTAPAPVLLASREFAPTGRLYCQFRVLGTGAATRDPVAVESRYLLRHALGATISQGVPGPMTVAREGQLVSFFGLPLDGLRSDPTSSS